MKTIFASLIFALCSCSLSAQVLLNAPDTKNSVTIKAGWDQTIATGINFSNSLNSVIKNRSTNFQIEFLSPFETFHQFNNGRISTGIQTELFTSRDFFDQRNDLMRIIVNSCN
ncbi:MAG: hypothetical protein CVT99_00070 [Bacteroidetes bacterium HGW-Bacteroidetes-16]|jgi:hypothetical protein|nr:MAG: hypothetical protein CVT99_00070 [Bacteroidetes bacterium HGW-Bacteroidetes-16]